MDVQRFQRRRHGPRVPFVAIATGTDIVWTADGQPPPSWAHRSLMDLPLSDRYHAKQGRATGAWVTPNRGQPVFVKRHYELPLYLRLLAAAAPARPWTPALREWLGLRRAAQAGVRVPAAILAAQFVGPGLRLQSVLVVEELRGYTPAHEWLVRVRQRFPASAASGITRQLMRSVAELAARLHRHRLFHKDLYLCHFFVPDQAVERSRLTPNDLVLIDFHRLARHRWAYLHWLVKDLAQLLYSAREAAVEADAIEQFFAVYWDRAGWPTPSRPLLRRLVERKAERYWQHNTKHGTRWRPPDRNRDAA